MDFSYEGLQNLLRSKIGGTKITKQVLNAFDIAFRGHSGQFRERTSIHSKPVPYIAHPVGVAILAAENFELDVWGDRFEDVISAALCHDVLEDTKISKSELARDLSPRTVELIVALTKPLASTFASREERTKHLHRSIENAGRTAAYIKICDSIHNLTRPELTPSKLLSKAILRGRQNQLEMFQRSGLPNKLVDLYLQALDTAETHLRAEQDIKTKMSASCESASDFNNLIVQVANHKVLEPHDIAEFFTSVVPNCVASVFNAASIFSKGSSEYGSNEFSFDRHTMRILERSNFGHRISEELGEGKFLYFYSTPELQTKKLVFAIIFAERPPSWLDDSLLLVGLNFLWSRQRERLSELKLQKMQRALSLGVHLDLDELEKHNISIEELDALARMFSLSSQWLAGLEETLDGAQLAGGMGLVERREARVKTVDSLLRKTWSRKVPPEEVEDLIGVRLIVPNRSDRQRVVEVLRQHLQRNNYPVARRIEEKFVETSRGYRGIHLLFRAKLNQNSEATVGCEFQIRSILDDAWARISQFEDYKKTNTVEKRNEKLLRFLRDGLDKLEDEIDRRSISTAPLS